MSSENASSAPTSDTTSNPAPKADATEAQFLQHQAEQAKAAISNTASEIGQKLGESVSIATWTREYPWMSLGAATVAGFVAASLIVPSKQQQALRRLRAIEEAMEPHREPSGNGHDKKADDDFGGGLGGFLMRQAIKALPSIASAIAMGVSGKPHRPDGDPSSPPPDGGPFTPS